jgi:hypothetical protein
VKSEILGKFKAKQSILNHTQEKDYLREWKNKNLIKESLENHTQNQKHTR